LLHEAKSKAVDILAAVNYCFSMINAASSDACSRNSRSAVVSHNTAFRIGPIHQMPSSIWVRPQFYDGLKKHMDIIPIF